MSKVSLGPRDKLFDVLCRHSSPNVVEYLRAYEGLDKPPEESFEVSCELINGIRVDKMRVAILGLRRRDVLKWVAACRLQIPLIEDLLFDNTTDLCFGIGLADYPSGSGVCRIKIYNEYEVDQSQAIKIEHILKSFLLLNISEAAFRRDLEKFKIIKLSAIDWDAEGRALLKVYFGPFNVGQFLASCSDEVLKDEAIAYDMLMKSNGFVEKVQISVTYSQFGRLLKTEIFYNTTRVVPFFKMFDPSKEASKFFVDLYRTFPKLALYVISFQLAPVEKIQFYFRVGMDCASKENP